MTVTKPLLDYLLVFPKAVSTILIAMLPIFELRGSIPIAIGTLDLPWWKAYIYSVIGNMIPVPFILLLLKHVVSFAKRFGPGKRLFDWIFERTRRKTEEKIKKYEGIALIFFVAIPLPVTGAWTGAIAAWLFDIEFERSVFFIFIGVLTAGVIVTVVWYGARELLHTSVWAFIGTIVLIGSLYGIYKWSKLNGANKEKGGSRR